MIANYKIKPIAKLSFYPVWEFSLDLADNIEDELYRDDIWTPINHNNILKHPENRFSMFPTGQILRDFQFQTLHHLQNQIISDIFDNTGTFAGMVNQYYPDGCDLETSVQVVKDYPGYKMLSHIDNRNSFAAIILNLIDNENSTELLYDGKVFHTGPTKAGTGLVFMNTEHSYHAVENKSDRARIVALMNLKLKMEPKFIID